MQEWRSGQAVCGDREGAAEQKDALGDMARIFSYHEKNESHFDRHRNFQAANER
jgi:hypothetical protein